MTPSPDYIGYAYGAFVAIGGMIGYLKASSLPSLLAGTISGSLIALGAYRYQHKGKPDLILAISSLLMVSMGKRFLNSKKLMPAGITSALSFAMVIRYGMKLLQKS
ncbi:hypothetical protein O181_052588 [Austropuccinia psidii MF-1]|uniref:Transmembrane protein 14C n=1 Tax=Austropuccinia psidii MF-1 TaxID=1389203 RepID=A0A9Q3HPJ3_9BASI|nr:hypothetical protein [Austropuccinia psidii MF-1]